MQLPRCSALHKLTIFSALHCLAGSSQAAPTRWCHPQSRLYLSHQHLTNKNVSAVLREACFPLQQSLLLSASPLPSLVLSVSTVSLPSLPPSGLLLLCLLSSTTSALVLSQHPPYYLPPSPHLLSPITPLLFLMSPLLFQSVHVLFLSCITFILFPLSPRLH